MDIKAVQEFIKGISDKQLNTPVLIVGDTGIGKSYQLKDLAKAQGEGFGFIDLRLATQEVTDLIGIPRTVQEGEGEFTTYWTRPNWWPKEGTRGILALEEVNRAPEDVRQAIFQLLTEWRLHTHVLPKGWSIVALINPDNNQYHVNQLDPAFKRRFIQIVMNAPHEIDWGIWAKKNEVHDDVIRFVSQFPKLLSIYEDISIDARPTPAGYHMLSTLLTAKAIPKQCLMEVATGIIGKEAAISFLQSLSRGFEKPITAKEIFEDYGKVKKRHADLLSEKRNDLLYVTMVDVIASCEVDEIKVDKKALDNFHEYLKDCKAETLTTIILRLNEKILNKLCKFDDLVAKVNSIKKEISEV